MLQSLRLLIDIQSIDADLSRIGDDFGRLPEEREALGQQVAAARQDVAAAEALLRAEEQEERQLEAQMRDQEALIVHLNGQTGQITSTHAYEALQHEIEHAGQESSRFETKALELMEAIDEAKTRLEQAQNTSSELEETLPARLAEIDERAQHLQAQMADLRERRQKECEQLEPGLLERYERIAQRHRPAVAVLSGKACPECRLALPPQLVLDVRRADAVHCCGHCQRLLVPASALAES